MVKYTFDLETGFEDQNKDKNNRLYINQLQNTLEKKDKHSI